MPIPLGYWQGQISNSAVVERLGKWRTVFAGWQLGTRQKGDPECDAVRDHREATLMHRLENTTLIRLCIEKGLFTRREFLDALDEEAAIMCKQLEERFPGITSADHGLTYDRRVTETMGDWKP